MTGREALLDPTGMDERTGEGTLAPRPATLRGLTLGLLDNTKPNATALLRAIESVLREHTEVGEFRLYAKDYFGTPVKDDLLKQIAAECDVVITAVGDCGSCSAATVADGICFERAGVPAVSIVSDSFLMSGRAMAKLQGFPGFEFLAAQHPVASLDSDGLRDRAEALVPQILRVLGVSE